MIIDIGELSALGHSTKIVKKSILASQGHDPYFVVALHAFEMLKKIGLRSDSRWHLTSRDVQIMHVLFAAACDDRFCGY